MYCLWFIKSIAMKKLWSLFALLFVLVSAEAQHRVTFRLVQRPASHSGDSIFVSGSFNRWKAVPEFAFSRSSDDTIQCTALLPADDYEYKCIRGSWDKVETGTGGTFKANRFLRLQSDTVIEVSIEAWRDDFPPEPPRHTVSDNVRVMDTAFFIPQLNRSRKIWVYLPPGYEKGNKHYPVLYMHDGQNLFDEFYSGFGEWGVDECLDSLIAKGRPASIVVGIENGPRRFNEYNPFYFERFGEGEGDAYIDFIANTLKPYIDRHYRTLRTKEHTLIAGSSMGGLISYYAILRKPDVFGKGGIFSPAFWTAGAIRSLTDSLASRMTAKVFFYMGGKEGGTYIQDMLDVQESLGAGSSSMIYSIIDPESGHNEPAWRKWFPEFYNWIMADGFNYVVKTKE